MPNDDLWERDPERRRQAFMEWVHTRPGPDPVTQLVRWDSTDQREAHHRFIAEGAVRHLGASTVGDGEHAEARAQLDLALAELQLVGTTRQLDLAEVHSKRLLLATWVLAGATVALVVATVVLAIVSARK